MNHIIEDADLMAEWDFEKNTAEGLYPEKVGMSSHFKANWRCKEGHEWKASVANRSRHRRGCPYCAHQLPIPGVTDLATCYPALAAEWDTEKNTVSASEVMPGTHKKAWWKCEKGHSYYSEVKSRTTGTGCPICAGKVVIPGVNDLETREPDLVKEWHPTLNGELKPCEVTFSSGKKVWWRCKYGHEYTASPDTHRKHNGCPVCLKSSRSSFPEQAIFYYVKQAFPDAINGYKDIFQRSMELDIYIPSIKTGIEYDGKVYHRKVENRMRDSGKYGICRQNGIMLIRVREAMPSSVFVVADHTIEIPDAGDSSLDSAISTILYHLGRLVDVNVARDKREIRLLLGERHNSFLEVFPEVAAEWDYEANGAQRPEQFSPHSNDKVCWRCRKCGDSWEAAISERTRKDGKATGCPKCSAFAGSAKRLNSLIGKNGSFAEQHPELMREWDYQMNGGVDPTKLTSSSGKKIWWLCTTCKQEWKTAISHRVAGRGCPVCSNKKIIPGFNDFATKHPDLLIEWDYEKNRNLDPTKIAPRTGKKAFWKCRICGHEWEAVIASRSNGVGCPNFRKHPKP